MSLNKKKSWKVLLVSLAAAISFSMLAACSSNNNTAAEDKSPAVATYKGGTITENEFAVDQRIMKFLSPQQAQYLEIDAFKESILKQEVAFEYLASQATDAAKKEAEKEADIQVATLKNGLGDTYESTLKKQEVTEADVRNYMVRILTVYQHMLLKVTDDEVTKQFEAVKGEFTVVNLHQIIVGLKDAEGKERSTADALKLAKEAKTKLDGGADFAEVAKEYSGESTVKDTGGEYKDKAIGTFPEAVKTVLQALDLNKISDPIETPAGYYIVKLESRTDKTFDQLTDDQKDKIKGTVATSHLEAFLEKDLDGIIEKINLPKSSAAADKPGTEPTAPPSAEAPAAIEAPAATKAAE